MTDETPEETSGIEELLKRAQLKGNPPSDSQVEAYNRLLQTERQSGPPPLNMPGPIPGTSVYPAFRSSPATPTPNAREKARVILFKPSGKYYTEEEWEIPTREEVIMRGGTGGHSLGPICMKYSKDFRRIGGGAILVDTQEPWGVPHLFPGTQSDGGN